MVRVSAFERDLRAAFRDATDETIRQVVALCNGTATRTEIDAVPAVEALIRQCYNPPSRHHKVMTALDSLLETHGCEYLGEVHMHDGPPVEYLNTGDPYVATIVWYRDSGKFKVQGWGDALEWCERHGVIERETDE